MSISPLDFVLLQLGSPGYYLVFLGFLICCLQLPIVFTEFVFKYYVWEPPHRCKVVSDHGNHQHQYTTWRDLKIHKNEWYPLVTVDRSPDPARISRSTVEQLFLGNYNSNSSSQIFDQCNIYIDPVHHWKGKQPCPNGWEYWIPNNEKNLVTEFNLVCENKFWLTLLIHLICISGLCGALVFGIVTDKLGRCRTLNFTIYLFIASTLSVYFVVDFLQFSIFYNLQIFFVNGLQIAAYVLLLEIFANPYQLKANFAWFTFRTLVSILASILLCAINNWRYVQLSIAVPSFAFITYLFVLPRSPLWQAVVKRNQRAAVRTLVHFSKFSGKPISINQLNQHVQNLMTSTIAQTSPNVDDATINRGSNQSKIQSPHPSLSKPGPILRWYMLTHSYLFFILAIINSELFDQHTLMLNQSHCINSIYDSLIDLAFIILSYQLCIWLGSRILQSLLFFLNGTLIVVSLVLIEYLRAKGTVEVDSFDFRLLLVPPILMVLARSIGRSITILIWFHAVKSIPTNIRATGLACCFLWTQIAKLCVPHLLILSNHMPYNSLHGMFGILAIISGALSLLFPRLEKKCWPNILADLEERRNHQYSNPSSTISSKQYPSYRSTTRKNYTSPKVRSASAHDIFTIPSRCEFDPNRSNTVRSVQIRNERFRKINEFLAIGGDHQQSLSSTSAKVETEKSSLSSGNNTVSDNQIEQSLIEISPSTSFTGQMISRPSYVAYNEIDPFGPNPNYEPDPGDNRIYTGRSKSIQV